MADTLPTTTSTTDDEDLSGRQVGDYRLLRRLGRGAMAEVYLAEQGSLRRQVALKVLRRSLASDQNYVQRFHFEAQAAAALVHANIVQIYEVGCVDGAHFIAQEYVQGMNLGELLARRGPPEVKQAVSIMRQTGAALHRAAQRGIVHRDIKPENIMLALTGEVKIADFGLARINDEAVQTNLTQAGFTMGTPLYMSPEQVEGKPLDPRSDLYSLGVTCFHMLAGEAPFRGETALAVAVQHLKKQPDRLETLRPDLPPALCRIVHKLLAKKPDDRYQSALEMLLDLRVLHVPGLESEPSVDLEGLADEAHETLRVTRLQATQRLQTLMDTTALHPLGRKSRRWLVACLAGAFVGGAGLAWVRRDRPLLSADASAPVRKDSAQAQFQYAREMDTVAAWKSVAAYFPDDREWVARANRELAQWYVQRRQFDKALRELEALTAIQRIDPRFRLEGLLGEAEVLSLMGRVPQMGQKLDELYSDRIMLGFVESGRERVVELLRSHREQLSSETVRQWEEFLGLSPSRSGRTSASGGARR